jgi:hypothetical protein
MYPCFYFFNIAHNLFIAIQKLKLAPEIRLANQTFAGVYILAKNQGYVWGCLGFRFVVEVRVYVLGLGCLSGYVARRCKDMLKQPKCQVVGQ